MLSTVRAPPRGRHSRTGMRHIRYRCERMPRLPRLFFLGEGYAGHAYVTIDDADTDGFEAFAHAAPLHTFSGGHFEKRAVLSANKPLARWIEELVPLPIEVDLFMRTTVYVAEYLAVPAHHDNIPRALASILFDAEQRKRLCTCDLECLSQRRWRRRRSCSSGWQICFGTH